MGQDEACPTLCEPSCDFGTHRKPSAWLVALPWAGTARGQKLLSSKVGETEHCLPEQLLFGAVSGCHFWGGTGAGKLGWVADGVKQEGSRCLFANMLRCRFIFARRANKISVGASCQLLQPQTLWQMNHLQPRSRSLSQKSSLREQ